jgi:hypothetical protein
MVILMQATNLQSLDVPRALALPSMSIASHTCSKSLVDVVITVSKSSELLTLTFLDRFTALRKLTVAVENLAGGKDVFSADISPWQMHHLRTLSLHADSVSTTATLELLSKCDAPNLQLLILSVRIQTIIMARRVADIFSSLSARNISLRLD